MTQTINVGLPVERHAQLAALAHRDGTSLADTIGGFLTTAIHEGRIADELPGWTVERVGNTVRLAHPESDLHLRMKRSTAKSVADLLDRMAEPAGTQNAGWLDLDESFEILRRGTSVKITDTTTGAYRAVARSIAGDLARLLRKAAA
ncbi:hypothetical protein [Pararhizobium mangrovi]|uniref:Uncharacterized protein n=1 Tax=Pararhizobium mangrovi TaxID=2590452 RepID=A0A506U097_9HYPH|nr:hypothetical protein [Pararhizobium mangrovi]TPW26395.1 hypothetical protein FJU11_15070 [Pararhizobium mangrovi]